MGSKLIWLIAVNLLNNTLVYSLFVPLLLWLFSATTKVNGKYCVLLGWPVYLSITVKTCLNLRMRVYPATSKLFFDIIITGKRLGANSASPSLYCPLLYLALVLLPTQGARTSNCFIFWYSFGFQVELPRGLSPVYCLQFTAWKTQIWRGFLPLCYLIEPFKFPSSPCVSNLPLSSNEPEMLCVWKH